MSKPLTAFAGHRIQVIALGLVLFAPPACYGEEPASATPPEDQGTVTSSGKFEATTPVPDPAAPADLAAGDYIKTDGDKVIIGKVELDRRTRCISLPAQVNMVDGTIEYLLVNLQGKVHESLLVTPALPRDFHTAALLAGWAKPGKDGKPFSIAVEVTWKTNGPTRTEPLDHLVQFTKDSREGALGSALETKPWFYGGSPLAAMREGSFISMIRDPSALVFNARPGRDDDELHTPNRRLVPRVGTPVRITFRPLTVKAASHSDESTP